MTLEEFYRENYPIVFGYLLSLCGSRTEAEDLTSETFLKAIQHISSYDDRGSPAAWLCTIGKNLYFNEQKRRKRQVSLPEEEGATLPLEDSFFAGEQVKFLLESAARLPMPGRQVFFMRLQRLSFRDIGAALNQTETWARVTFFRVKNTLLREWEEYNGTM